MTSCRSVLSLAVLLLASAPLALAQSNPVPLINNPLVPDAVAPGGPSFTLTVNGTGFVSGSTVNWNGVPLATTFVTGSQVTAIIPAPDVWSVGTSSVSVVNPAPGGGVSNVEFFQVRKPFGAVSFGQSSYGVGGSPTLLVAADLNGDGEQDLIATDLTSSAVSVLIGNGDGTFQPNQEYATAASPFQVVAADFNGDGSVDLAVSTAEFVSILIGSGNGTFQAHQDYSLVSGGLAAGDFNGDGALDLVVTTANGEVAILLGNGDGTFQSPLEYVVNASSKLVGVTIGDFNNDGKLDLAVGTEISGTYILLGNGDGTFQNSLMVSADSSVISVAADLNGDGNLDLVLSGVDVLLGNGDGTFQVAQSFPVPVAKSFGIAVADLNGDGNLDIAVTNDVQTVTTFLGNGDGTFQKPGFFYAGPAPGGIVAADFNGDGKIDLAATNQSTNDSVSVLPQVTSVLSRTNIAFGKVSVGSSATADVKLSNIGTSSFAITSISLAGRTRDSYTEANTCGTSLGAGAYCTITIKFKPLTNRSYTGVFVEVADSAVNETQIIMIRGTGTN